MPGASYDALHGKKQKLIRKARKGSVFVAPLSADHIETLTDATDGGLAVLPTGYKDVGWLSDDGASFSSDIDVSDVTSWGSVTPTRTDLNSESTELQITCQETNLSTIGLYVGVATAGLQASAGSGELKIVKPLSPVKQSYHVLSLAVDETEDGEVYIARYWPNAEVTDKDDQAFNKEDPLGWPITMSARPDSELGYSETWFFGGPGWEALLADMGITQASA